MKIIKYHPINDLQGYAVHRVGNEYRIAFVTRFVDFEGVVTFKMEGESYSKGRLHSYPSPFVADYVIRKEILPLYKKAA